MNSSRYRNLLAKKRSEQDKIHTEERLVGHITHVVASAQAIIETLGKTSILQMGISDSRWGEAQKTLILAAYLHDFGKANSHFQWMIRDKKTLPDRQQMIRHEILSGYIAWFIPEIKTWLENIQSVNLPIAIWAATGHHLKCNEALGNFFPACSDGRREKAYNPEIILFLNHEDFQTNLLNYGRHLFPELPSPPILDEPVLKDDRQRDGQIDQISKQIADEFREISETLSDEDKRLLAWVKAMLIAADVAGSAIPSEKCKPEQFIRKALSEVLSEEDLTKLIEHRIGKQPVKDSHKADLAKRVSQTKSRVSLVMAGCGTGKTIAAYEWAKKHSIGKKLVFAYPTTGTATAGFRDYGAEVDLNIKLLHSKSIVDLEDIHITDDEDALDGIPKSVLDLDAVNAWPMKAIVCTVDTVLGIIQNHRRALISFPLWSNTSFVFDEIHAYSPRLFQFLLRFLQTFRGAKILLMTASLPPHYLEALKKTLNGLDEDIEIIYGPKPLEDLPRYRLQRADNLEEAYNIVQHAVVDQKKVLWVANTVGESRRIYEQLETRLKSPFQDEEIPLFLYHSSFRYQDRVNRQNEVIRAFDPKETPGAAIVVSTQVCEMSLDISADVLITEEAPPPALIQRLGRLNRRTTVETLKPSALALITPPTKTGQIVYKDELETIEPFLKLLPNENVSQSHLAEALAQITLEQSLDVAEKTQWLDFDWQTPSSDTIRESGTNISVLLELDQNRCFSKKDLLKWLVPISASGSRGREIMGWPKHSKFRVPIATHRIQYDKETGAQWL
jgi:CRISPR-associated endonuclease/helicase Cas3